MDIELDVDLSVWGVPFMVATWSLEDKLHTRHGEWAGTRWFREVLLRVLCFSVTFRWIERVQVP